MAQTTGAMSGVGLKIMVSNNNSDWTDISGQANSVTPSGFNRQSGETYTFDGDHAIIGKGKREPIELEVNTVYTETAGQAFVLAWAEFDADDGDSFWVRWSPAGGVTGNAAYTSTTGIITSLLPPSGEAAPGDPLMAAFTVKCASVDKSTLAGSW
uniref:Tail protein n=1 Tax=viral metagenome TaxID=1070528 RepID=A0A6M3J694_9ZZZZ